MDAVLSVQGASAPVKKKSFFSKFTRLNMLRLVRAVIPVSGSITGATGRDADLLPEYSGGHTDHLPGQRQHA